MTLTCVRRLLNLDVDVWIHLNCALWSLEVYETLNGALMNVEAAVKRGKTVVRETQLYVQPAHSSTLLSSIFILHFSVLRSLLSFSSLSYALFFCLLLLFCSPLLLFSFHFSPALLFSSEFFRLPFSPSFPFMNTSVLISRLFFLYLSLFYLFNLTCRLNSLNFRIVSCAKGKVLRWFVAKC